MTRLRNWRSFVIPMSLLAVGFGVLLGIIAYRWAARPRYAELLMTQVMDAAAFPPGDYYDVAWVNDTLLAFLYLPSEDYDPERLPSLWELQLILFDLTDGEWSLGPLPPSDTCESSGIRTIGRLPNFSLGFLFRCNSDDPVRNGVTLYAWDPRSSQLQPLQFYRANFRASRFSYSPDMTVLLQENAIGAGLNNQLFRVDEGGDLTQMFVDWQRMSAPSWSPDGQTIAFIGTQGYPAGTPQTFTQIEALARHAWGLYLVDANEDNLRVLLPDVAVGRMQWLPHGEQLAFSGAYKNVAGIWVLSPANQQVARIWSSWTLYDFSPDGTQAVILQRFDVDGNIRYRPIIVAVPPELYATPLP